MILTGLASTICCTLLKLCKELSIVLGKTNIALMLAADDSDNPVYGRTNNPYDLTRTSGGSSGGEGAIIGAGGSILGIGSDIGGSIRLPSAHCGIFGLKPTSGRLTLSGHAEVYRGMEAIMAQMGPMGRSTSNLNSRLISCRTSISCFTTNT